MTKITGIIFIWQHRSHQCLRFVDVREEGWICEMRTQKARSTEQRCKTLLLHLDSSITLPAVAVAMSNIARRVLLTFTLYCFTCVLYMLCLCLNFFYETMQLLSPMIASQWDHDWVKIMWSSSHKSQKVSSPTFWRGLSITRDKKNENSSFVIDLSSALGTHKLPYCLQQPAQLAQRWHCLVISCIVKVVTRFKYTHECAV